ncbi:unnamed protein product [Cylicocyclus nassatus]|uniref:Uncharacterized protein n=1 Tax=Cylicocyclus nassatus TaxID=53992 RepID=A0AA36MAT2_CYLNA|nr:unnamed protein product [Cylicocyclus nassatus]
MILTVCISSFVKFSLYSIITLAPNQILPFMARYDASERELRAAEPSVNLGSLFTIFLAFNAAAFFTFAIILLIVEVKSWQWRAKCDLLESSNGQEILSIEAGEIPLSPNECIALLGSKNDSLAIMEDLATNCENISEISVCSLKSTLDPFLSLKFNLKMIASVAGYPFADVEKLILPAMGGENQLRSPFSSYSYLKQRRASVTAAALTNSKVIIFELPTKDTSLYTWNIMRDVQQAGRTVIFTTNSIEECEMIADQVGIMSEGKIIKIATFQELKERYGMLMVLEVYTTCSNRVEVINSIASKFPNYLNLPSSASHPLRLRWKLDFSHGPDFGEKCRRLNEHLLTLPIDRSRIMSAPLDVLAQSVIDEFERSEHSLS